MREGKLNKNASRTTEVEKDVVKEAVKNQDQQDLDDQTEKYQALLLKIAERNADKA